MIERRTLLFGSAGLAAALPARPQAPGRTYRIGYLGFTASNTADDLRDWNGFVERLRDLGFSEGRNLVIEQRFAEGRNERYTDLAVELVRMKVDLVVVTSGTSARAVMAASRSLQIVTLSIPDPVRAGLVATMARPGGQLTGMSNLAEELTPKRIELLKLVVPSARLIAFARCRSCSLTAGESPEAVAAMYLEHERAARALGVGWLPLDVDSADDFVNPPELPMMQELIKQVKKGRFILLPITDETRGHGTHSLPAIWGGELVKFLKEIP